MAADEQLVGVYIGVCLQEGLMEDQITADQIVVLVRVRAFSTKPESYLLKGVSVMTQVGQLIAIHLDL